MRESTPEMVEALRLTRAGRLAEATALIQRSLGRAPASATYPDDPTPTTTRTTEATYRVVSVDPVSARLPAAVPAEYTRAHPPRGDNGPAKAVPQPSRHGPAIGLGVSAPRPAGMTVTEIAAGGRFITLAHTGPAGTRGYKLYVPSGYAGQAVPLVVMLHGCSQTADDIAAGTRLNRLAEQVSWLVVYPEQAASANPSRCWNWFEGAHQRRGEGEPSLIAGITQDVMATYQVDPQRVYVAGMSAGGAMAATMGAAYPDLYAAVGVHSGLPSGAAHDLPSAFAVMRRGKPTRTGQGGAGPRVDLPTIVFHGDRDATVHPRNAEHVLAQVVRLSAGDHDRRPSLKVTQGQVPDGHAYTRTLYRDATGQVVAEQWRVADAGHAWSGGSPSGSFTDPHGPDASTEMLRFFREHPKHTPAQ